MLRRNLDTKHGLVNGSIGTVLAITSHCITVKFDQILEPYTIEKGEKQVYAYAKFLCLSKTIPAYSCIGCYHTQMPGTFT